MSSSASPQRDGAAATALTEILENTVGAGGEKQPMQDALGLLLAGLLQSEPAQRKVNKAVVDGLIAKVDEQLSRHVDAILHHAEFQRMESTWRGLRFLIDRTDFRENVQVEIVDVSKTALQADFEDCAEIYQSGLYHAVYKRNIGVFGGVPVAAIVGLYEWGPGGEDVQLLGKVAAVAATAHAPFLSSASPEFFGDAKDAKDMTVLQQRKDLKDWFDGARFAKWRGFRDTENARYVGLTCPRFLLRTPYAEGSLGARRFAYREDVTGRHASYLWGNSAIALATRLTEAFAKYRWCANVIGPQGGGTVSDLPLHHYEAMGALQTKPPTELLLEHRRDFELAEAGFIPLVMRKHSDNACFFSANSAKQPKTFGQTKEGKQAEANERLGCQLPYMMVVNRLAHYVKALQTERIGSSTSRQALQQELDKWIGQYVLDQDVAPAGSFARRPLRSAKITVDDVEGEPGWYRVAISVRPHFKYMGAFFDLSLVSKMKQE